MARLLDGKAVAAVIRQQIAKAVEGYSRQGITPRLDAVLVGDDPGSVHYARAKERAAKSLGIEFKLHQLPGTTTDDELLKQLQILNGDRAVHGIVLELPLPRHLDQARILESISPVKDVDGVHPVNRGRLMSGTEALYPATPLSCMEILLAHGIGIAGKHAVIVGRGETVGKPLLFLLLRENATVTVCHTRTVDLTGHTRQADLLVTAAGRAGLIGAGMVKPGAVVVDAGINPVEGGVVGDVDFEAVRGVVSAITPVPGGVGSVTTVLVLGNLLQAMKMQGVGGGVPVMSYREWSLGEFLERAGSADPTPGGGSAAAVAGALGVAMAAMVANLTLGRARYRDVEPEVRAILKEAGGLRRELETLAAEDSTVFERLLETYRMSRNTDQEGEQRREAIQAALRQATEIPLEVARAGLETLRLAERLAAIGNEQALSDAGVGAYLAGASVRSALMNVMINARQLEDRKLVERLMRESKRFGNQAVEVERLVERTVIRRLGLTAGRNSER